MCCHSRVLLPHFPPASNSIDTQTPRDLSQLQRSEGCGCDATLLHSLGTAVQWHIKSAIAAPAASINGRASFLANACSLSHQHHELGAVTAMLGGLSPTAQLQQLLLLSAVRWVLLWRVLVSINQNQIALASANIKPFHCKSHTSLTAQSFTNKQSPSSSSTTL